MSNLVERITGKAPNSTLFGTMLVGCAAVVSAFGAYGQSNIKIIKWDLSLLLVLIVFFYLFIASIIYDFIIAPLLLKASSWAPIFRRILLVLERFLSLLRLIIKRIYWLILLPVKIFIVKPIFDELYIQVNKSATTFEDDFKKDLSKWVVIEGSPVIEDTKIGVLKLHFPGSTSRNSMIGIPDLNIHKGTIKCKLFLAANESLLNFVVGSDITFTDYYMIRIDARNTGHIGILKAQGKYSWTLIYSSDYQIPYNKWIDIKVVFDSQNVKVFIDNKNAFEHRLNKEIIPIGKIGIFNEVGQVNVKEFEFSEN